MDTKLSEIELKRPNGQIKSADSVVQTYIQMLEKKLENSEKRCLDLQGALFHCQLQVNKFFQQNEMQTKMIQQVQANNVQLESEKNKLKLQLAAKERCESNKSNGRGNKMKEVRSTASSSNTQKQCQEPLSNNSDAKANCVLVKGFSEVQFNAIPKVNIINLGRHMDIKISEKDIIEVSKLENKFYARHNLKPNKIILIVQFRNAELKIDFLKNKEKLKIKDKFSDIEIADYVSDEVYNLYQYAKILKNHGYELIYWRNNSVYAKKNRSTLCEAILIESKNHVDNLKSASV